MRHVAAGHPTARHLRTIPGVGSSLSLALAEEMGDVERFPSITHLRGCSIVAPAVYQSGDKDVRGRLTKTGNTWLRHAAVPAAQRIGQMRRPDPRPKRMSLSVAFRRGRNPPRIGAGVRLPALANQRALWGRGMWMRLGRRADCS